MQLQPNIGPKLDMGLPPVLGESPEKAASYLCQAGWLKRKVENAGAYLQIQIGLQLQLIRTDRLWAAMERRDYTDPSNPQGTPAWANDDARFYVSFEDFMTNGFPIVAGLERRTGYHCLLLAGSGELRKIGPEIKEFRSISNALELARVEQKGEKTVTPQMREDAKVMPHSEFVERHGLDKPVRAANVEAGGDKQFLLEEWINRLDQQHLRNLREFIERALPTCGDNANDVVDMIEAAVRQEWQEQEAHERAELTGE